MGNCGIVKVVVTEIEVFEMDKSEDGGRDCPVDGSEFGGIEELKLRIDAPLKHVWVGVSDVDGDDMGGIGTTNSTPTAAVFTFP